MATRPIDIAKRLVSLDYEVTIFASNFSNYTLRNVRPLGLRLWRTECVDGVFLVWIRTPAYKSNGLDRVMNIVSFTLLVTLAGIFRRNRPDVIVGVTTHPLAALAGWAIAKARRARFFFEVTVLWPETLIQFGRLQRDSAPARALRGVERFLYDRAERIIMLWRDTESYVRSTGADARKIVWIPHGVELDRYAAVRSYDGIIRGPFRLMFFGGFNSANSIGTIMDAAAILLARKRTDIQIDLVGAGLEKRHWIEHVRRHRLTNVDFPAPTPKTDIAAALSKADGFVYGLRDIDLYKFGITLNKLFDYLAARRPIVFFGRTSYDPVALASAGYVVPPANPGALADAIERLANESPASRVAMGQRGFDFLLQHHLIPQLADKYDRLFRPAASAEPLK